MGIIAHLFTAFQTQYNLSKGELSPKMVNSFTDFINDYKIELQKNVELFYDFVEVLSK